MKIRAISLIIAIFFPVTLFASNTTCPLSNGINVLTKKRILNICKNGTVVKTFKVALGYKGVGKKRLGITKLQLVYMG